MSPSDSTSTSTTTTPVSSFTQNKNTEDTERSEMNPCPCPALRPTHDKLAIDSNTISDSSGTCSEDSDVNINNIIITTTTTDGAEISHNNSINNSSSSTSLISHSSNAFSCDSATSMDTSSTNNTNTDNENTTKKRVSFSLQQTAYFSPEQQQTKYDRKAACWYSEAELTISRDEARMTIHALHHQLQLDATTAAAATATKPTATVRELVAEEGSSNHHDDDNNNETTSMSMPATISSSPKLSAVTSGTVDDLDLECSSSNSSSGNSNATTNTDTDTASGSGSCTENNTWELRCPHDRSKIMCLRGIEKYADAAAKYAGQKRLVHSVLQQQTLMNNMIDVNSNINNNINKDAHISMVSRTLSEPFKEVAHYYAMKAADELKSSRKLEEEKKQQQQQQKQGNERQQREEVASVLLLMLNQQQQQQKMETQQDETLLSPAAIPKNLLMPQSPRESVVSRSGSESVTPSKLKRLSSNTNSPLSERNVRPCI